MTDLVTPTGLVRPNLAHVPDRAWPALSDRRGIQVSFDLRLGGRYVTAECQMGAHHACPGGLRTETQMPVAEHRCRCVADGCSCKPAQKT